MLKVWVVQMLVQFNLFLCFSPHESAGLFSASSQQQTANTLSPFCTTSPSIRSSPHSHLRAADPPALPSVSHKKTPVSFRRLLQTLLLIARLIYSRKVFFFLLLHTFTLWKPRQTAHTAADLTEIQYILLLESLSFHPLNQRNPLDSKFNPIFCYFFAGFLKRKKKDEPVRPAVKYVW